MKIYKSLFVLSCASIAFTGTAYADTTIVDNGKSTFSIVIPAKSPQSIIDAAAELQKDIHLSTGAMLPIKNDSEKITESIISLGATKQAVAANVTSKDIAEEGFHILTKSDNLYIIGPDTAADIGPEKDDWGWRSDNYSYQLRPDVPGKQLTEKGGFSNGTANGVYTFLENYLDVRWLMPGEIGRDVPQKSTFTVPDIDHTEAPAFIQRIIRYLYPARQKTAAAQQWAFQQKLGFSVRVNAEHQWARAVPKSQFERHPEWFAMIKGKRQDPSTVRYKNRYKLETTNPSLVKYYARRAISALKHNPQDYTYSLSATDSRGYSESPESKKLYDPNPTGGIHPSVTPLILKFYRDVANIVAKEYPEGRLAGYIYQDFRYPPQQGSAVIPQNVYPVLAGNGYGYGYYRKDLRDDQEKWMKDWVTRSKNSNWLYYGIPNNMSNSEGIIMPPAPDILNFVFGILRENKFKGALLYGGPSWSQEAASNYIQAKMLWDPSLDAHDLQKEWLTRAYGEKAGTIIEKLYNQMDNGAFAEYKRENPGSSTVTEKIFQEYYALHYKKFEAAVLEAQEQPKTKVQQARLQLFADNVIILQWRLKNAGYIAADYQSSLTRSNQQVAELLQAQQDDDFQLFPGSIYPAGKNKVFTGITPTKVELSEDFKTSGKSNAIPNSQQILLYPQRDGYLHLQFDNVRPGSSFLSYRITESVSGRDIQSGIIYDNLEVPVMVRKNAGYYLTIAANGVRNPQVKWDLRIPNASSTHALFQDGAVHLQEKESPILVFVPENVPQKIREDNNGITLFTPLTAVEKMQQQYPNAKDIQDLDNDWKFQPDPKKDGEKQGFAGADFDDANWKEIAATKQWQFQGFPDFHGTGWYRKTFTAEFANADYDPDETQRILLYFGAIDGSAEIYLNGKKLGEHLLRKDNEGWDEPFAFDITEMMNDGKNIIAVKVTKDAPDLAGGMFGGVRLQVADNK